MDVRFIKDPSRDAAKWDIAHDASRALTVEGTVSVAPGGRSTAPSSKLAPASGSPRHPVPKIANGRPRRSAAPAQGGVEHGGRDRVELQLGPAEHREGAPGVDGAPVQVDEPAAGRTLDIVRRHLPEQLRR